MFEKLRVRRRSRKICNTSDDFEENKLRHDREIIENSYFTINNLLYIDYKDIELINKIMDDDTPFFITNYSGNIIHASYMWSYVYNCDVKCILSKKFNIFQNKQTDMDKCRLFREELEKNGESRMTIINSTLDKKENIKLKLYSKRLTKVNNNYDKNSFFTPYYLGIVESWEVI
jgi:hypothetical protein